MLLKNKALKKINNVIYVTLLCGYSKLVQPLLYPFCLIELYVHVMDSDIT